MRLILILAVLGINYSILVNADDDFDRDPASISPVTNGVQKIKPFPGGEDEEDLKIISIFPEAPVATNSRAVQQEVYKDIYKKELKDDRTDPVEE